MFVLSVLEAPNTKTNSLCVQTHLAIKLFLILILILKLRKVTRILEKVSAWLDASFLTLITKKTKSICFSIRELPVTKSLNIRIKDEIIEQVSEEKYIMIFDYQLNFKSHAKKLCKTI